MALRELDIKINVTRRRKDPEGQSLSKGVIDRTEIEATMERMSKKKRFTWKNFENEGYCRLKYSRISFDIFIKLTKYINQNTFIGTHNLELGLSS